MGLLIMLGILMLMVIWVVTTDSHFLPLPLRLPKNPQLLRPERNVKLRLKLILNLGIMDTTDMDMVDTMDILMDMLTTDKQIRKNFDLERRKKKLSSNKTQPKNCCHLIMCSRSYKKIENIQ